MAVIEQMYYTMTVSYTHLDLYKRQTLKVDKNQATSGDKVKVSVKIKDEDDMQSAYIYYLSGMTDNLQMIELNYNEKTKYYEGYIEILDSSESGTWKVESILTVDKRNRTTNTYNSLTVNDTTLENRQDLSSGDFTVSNTDVYKRQVNLWN